MTAQAYTAGAYEHLARSVDAPLDRLHAVIAGAGAQEAFGFLRDEAEGSPRTSDASGSGRMALVACGRLEASAPSA